jgi:Flp pilus assembly protein TadD
MKQLLRLLLLVFAVLPSVAQAEWRRAESPHFVMFSEESERGLRNRISQLEDFHALLVQMTRVEESLATNKLHVYVVRSHRELETVRRVPRNIAGYYVASTEGILAVVNAEAEGPRSNEVLFHEYAHHFMMQYLTAPYPAWYVEGFAEYLSTAKLERERIDIGLYSPGRIYSASQGPWLPLERIISAGPEGLNAEGAAAYYAQAWLMTHYFFSTPERQAAMLRYLALAGSQPPAQALTTATGKSLEQLTRELRRYISGGSIAYRRMARNGPTATAVTITTMPRSADDLLLYAAALRIGLSNDVAPTMLARIRTAAQRHAADPLARRTLAYAETLHGDRAAALRLLEALTAEAPNDAELLYLRGRLHFENAQQGGNREAELRAARQWFGRAHRADPNQFQSLYRFALTHGEGAQATSENTANALLLAQQLAPQVVEIRLNAASLQIARGKIDYAEALLRPVLNDPHQPQLAEAARQMLQEARGRTASSSPTSAEPAPRN